MQEKWDLQTYCEILGVSKNSPQHEIHAAYLKAKKTYSKLNPELGKSFSFQEAETLENLVEEAFAILGNHSMRAFYQRKSEPKKKALNNIAFQMTANEVMQTQPGFKKTPFGSYQVDLKIEHELANKQVLDGFYLKLVRQYKNISIPQLSQRTKIKSTYIAAIECNDYDSLPAPVYTRGFIIQISKTLDLPAEEVASSFMCHYKNKNEQSI